MSDVIYLASVFDGIKFFCFIGAVLLTFFSIVMTCALAEDHELKEHKWFVTSCWIITAAVALGCIFVPSKETYLLMKGADIAAEMGKSPEAKDIGGKILKLINKKLDNELKEKE